MSDTILETIKLFINEGGPLALWGIVIYYVLGILKILAIGGVLCFLIRGTASGVVSVYSAVSSVSSARISLISSSTETKLSSLLSDFSTNLQAPVVESLGRLGGLLDRLETAQAKRSPLAEQTSESEQPSEQT